MVMNYKEIPISGKDRKKFEKGIVVINAVADALHSEGLLPERFSQISKDKTTQAQEVAPIKDLRQQTYELLALVREPTEEEKEALEKRGIVFLTTETKSLSRVVLHDPDYFWSGEQEYVDSKKELREYVPPVAMEVGLNPENPAIPGSFNKSKKVQLEMIERGSLELQKEFSDARLVMLPSTIYAQADKAYKGKTGEVFFRNIFARALDQTSGVRSAGVGRFVPGSRLRVDEWSAGDGYGRVGAVPAVVFLRK